ncbi:hypothetical protein HCH_06089 [Hahella chejuensis KCTC 2396]|uniref:Uncharacterized protein n=1 Tax=Hahella chejuensis (strain KCTC 2396) TaxID=349521 RepID=Q2S9D7_HAHCH|nr:hypothetical protein HCH_06089 [Hahella chejuensis KCTC 2396]
MQRLLAFVRILAVGIFGFIFITIVNEPPHT